MTGTDPLMAALRQLAGGKATSRPASQGATIAKDNKGKVEDSKGKIEQFREQFRLIAQGAKHGSQPDVKGAETDLTQGPEVADHVAEVADEVTTRSKDRARRPAENSRHRAAGQTTLLSPEWRAPEAALSSVMSRLDQTRVLSPADDDATPRAAQSQTHVEQRAKPLKPGEPTNGSEADVLPEPRFASSISAAETRTAAIVKVVVREQETHFEPVPQLTLLQKIVDRIAPDLPTGAAQPGPYSAEVALHQTTETPIRMLTLQLDPPNMGTVTVRMRLTGDAVEVRLSADRHETTQLLREERGALTDAMQSAGYSFEIASIDHSRTSDANPGAGQSHAQSEQQQSQQPQGGSQIDNGAPQRQSNDAQSGTRHNRQGHDQLTKPAERHQDEQIVLDSNGGALYL
jgi:chemotaxis protein MotD